MLYSPEHGQYMMVQILFNTILWFVLSNSLIFVRYLSRLFNLYSLLQIIIFFNRFLLQVNQTQSLKYHVDKYLRLYLTIIGIVAFLRLCLFTLYVFYKFESNIIFTILSISLYCLNTFACAVFSATVSSLSSFWSLRCYLISELGRTRAVTALLEIILIENSRLCTFAGVINV